MLMKACFKEASPDLSKRKGGQTACAYCFIIFHFFIYHLAALPRIEMFSWFSSKSQHRLLQVTQELSLFCTQLFETLASPKLMSLGKAQINLALLSFFIYFAIARWRNYSVSAKKERTFFVLHSTFRNFAALNQSII